VIKAGCDLVRFGDRSLPESIVQFTGKHRKDRNGKMVIEIRRFGKPREDYLEFWMHARDCPCKRKGAA
jgi:hypothetical protein